MVAKLLLITLSSRLVLFSCHQAKLVAELYISRKLDARQIYTRLSHFQGAKTVEEWLQMRMRDPRRRARFVSPKEPWGAN
jgi:hypothetical protein